MSGSGNSVIKRSSLSLARKKGKRSTGRQDGLGEISWRWVLGRALKVARGIWAPGGQQRDFGGSWEEDGPELSRLQNRGGEYEQLSRRPHC